MLAIEKSNKNQVYEIRRSYSLSKDISRYLNMSFRFILFPFSMKYKTQYPGIDIPLYRETLKEPLFG